METTSYDYLIGKEVTIGSQYALLWRYLPVTGRRATVQNVTRFHPDTEAKYKSSYQVHVTILFIDSGYSYQRNWSIHQDDCLFVPISNKEAAEVFLKR